MTEVSDLEFADPQPPPTAVLCWRPAKERRSGQLDVLLQRRVSDEGEVSWGLPRAVPQDGETLPESAVRALDPRSKPRLGRRLDVPGPTVVWSARLRDKAAAGKKGPAKDRSGRTTLSPDGDRDHAPWLPAQDALDLLKDVDEKAAVTVAIAEAAANLLDTRPVLILRHAKARPRARWSRADAERPLVELGRRQSVALAGLLECWHPEYLLCSPWRRCVDTMVPYVSSQGLRIRTKGGLTELSYRSSPRKASGHLRDVLGKGEPSLVCTHRPVLETLMADLAERSTNVARESIPRQDPFLAPAEVLVAHVAKEASSGRWSVVAVERHRSVL